MNDIPSIAIWIGLTFVAAGFVKGVVGMGLPAIAMGALSLVMAPASAAAVLVLPSLLTNVWQLFAGPNFGVLLRRLAMMLLGLCVGTGLGIGVLTGESAALAGAALGAALAAYGAVSLAAPRFTVPARAEPWLSPLIGLLTGLVTGATGIFSLPAVPYINSLGLAKEELIQALGLSFTVSTLALAVALAWSGHFQLALAGSSLLALLPALAGMYLGQGLRGKLQPEVFRKWFLTGLILLGAYMLARVLVPK